MAKTKAKTKTREVGDSAPKSLTIKSTNPAIMSEQIHQLAKMIKSSDEASEIAYDNTDSGLTAENVQAAIDEVATGLSGLEASDVAYDNTDSGLTADDVQAAIDENAGAIALRVKIDDTYITSATIEGYEGSNRISITCNLPTTGDFTKIDFYADHIRVRTVAGEVTTDKSVNLS